MAASPEADPGRLVGSDRVLAVLVELAERPQGATLEELAVAVDSPKSTVHRALSSLRRARLATQLGRGTYVVGDEFLRLAFENHAQRPDRLVVEPILRALVDRFGETAHYAVRDGAEIVYRAKVDPSSGSVRLTSTVGGRNPAYRTAVGKLLLSEAVRDAGELAEIVGAGPFEARTPHTITTLDELWGEVRRTRERGYAVDDQENEVGVNCVAVPVGVGAADPGMTGAVSVSALAFRLPLAELVARADEIRGLVADAGRGSL
ncbi:IclR family transcriptional regulator [Microbacterium sp. ASV49]|uniref:IclR family transcriptional regulator n=1 Tax=Microbacterium candidum TaxID=3041922 RepID=A0ABT7MWC0_9MICO|nr:IclR family transcriptional regulator [Microbacterium sp. ASV49]MDL9978746.1 IclR family transcriptional regulator [Microbacterium sp. ASV49]